MDYYNENDPFAAQWLRNLIEGGLIPKGEVDDRGIEDVRAVDLAGYRQCHFFAGIGGWAYALQLAGFGGECWTGSCPCQPFSAAGKGKGVEDPRHLWPIWFELIRRCRPRVVFGEQVASASVIGHSKEMQTLRRRKNERFIQGSQSWRFTRGLPRLRERRDTPEKALENAGKEGLSGGEASYSSGIFLGERGETQGLEKEDSIRSGLEGNSRADRYWHLRSDRDTIQSGQPEELGCAIPGPDRSGRWVYQGKHQGGSLRPKHNGKCLGDGFNTEIVGFDSGETVREQIEHILSETIRKPEEEASNAWADRVQHDLGGEGYSFGACVIPACSVNAPHIRQRLYWVAFSDCGGLEVSDLHLRPGRQNEAETVERGSSGLAHSGSECGEHLGLDLAAETGDPQGEAYQWKRLRDDFGNVCGTSELAHAEGSERQLSQRTRNGGAGSSDGSWGGGWLYCRDGKFRRVPVEPGVQPLAHDGQCICGERLGQLCSCEKRPSRIGMLKGAGNAIVPAVAAEFIKAALDSVS